MNVKTGLEKERKKMCEWTGYRELLHDVKLLKAKGGTWMGAFIPGTLKDE